MAPLASYKFAPIIIFVVRLTCHVDQDVLKEELPKHDWELLRNWPREAFQATYSRKSDILTFAPSSTEAPD